MVIEQKKMHTIQTSERLQIPFKYMGKWIQNSLKSMEKP